MKYTPPTDLEIDEVIEIITSAGSDEGLIMSDRQWLITIRALEAFKEEDIG